jgi:hypothetical protein
MKKLLPLIIVGVLVLSGLVGAADLSNSKNTGNLQTKYISFSEPILEEKNGYFILKLNGANNELIDSGNPMLPTYITSFMFSWNAEIKSVTCSFSDVKEMTINKKIIPVAEPILLTGDSIVSESQVKENVEVYESDALFPETWYNYYITCGLNNANQQSIFVTVTFYPVRYAPEINKLYYVNNVEIIINYDDSRYQPISNPESYDMVIIASRKFSSTLNTFIEHKNESGVKTILKTTESIYDEFSGRDKPEQIKYFLKYAKENWGITYVLLIGGLKSYINARDREDVNQGSKDWWIPVRYTNIPEDEGHGCISDLYYGDLYRYNTTTNTTEFEDWDSNGNNIFAEWAGLIKDKLDLNPDIYYGRIPCVNTFELKIVINKIIEYENTPPTEKPWFKTMAGVAGKTFAKYLGQMDGEYLCNLSFNYMDDLIDNNVTIYATNNYTGGLVPTPKDIIKTINEGAGYIVFEGHGSPLAWNTIWADGVYPKDWTGGLHFGHLKQLKNGNKLPIVIVGGCHNALFNLTMIKALRSGNYKWAKIPILKNLVINGTWYWTSGIPVPRCLCWWLVALPRGGAIACTGCTGFGIGPGGGDPNKLSGKLETNFFYQIGQNGSTTLGAAHSGSIQKYVLEDTVPSATAAHCVTVYQLFGDPSLKLGGYEK